MKTTDFLPRKLDIVEAETDADLWQIAMNIEIVVDGKLSHGVTAFNLDEGWVARFKEDENGKFIPDPTHSFFVIERIYTPNIEIRWK